MQVACRAILIAAGFLLWSISLWLFAGCCPIGEDASLLLILLLPIVWSGLLYLWLNLRPREEFCESAAAGRSPSATRDSSEQKYEPLWRLNRQSALQLLEQRTRVCTLATWESVHLPTLLPRRKDHGSHSDNDALQCSICLQDMAKTDRVRGLACGHCFHATCLGQWFIDDLDKSFSLPCPLCRTTLMSQGVITTAASEDCDSV